MMKKRIAVWILFGAILLAGLVYLVPVVLTVIGSFLLNGKVSGVGYRTLFFHCFPFYRMFWNSVLYAFSVTVGAVLIAIPAAYGFRFAKFPGKNVLYVIYIILMMMPLQVMILPNYIGLRDLKLLNTPFAIIVPLLFSPLAVVVLHQYLRECDVAVVEAARLETNSCLKVIWHCIVPQLKVCIFAVGLLIFAETWNLVEQPLLYLNEDKWRNLSLLFSESERYEAEVLLPAAVLFMVPVLLWYLLFRDELKKGLRLNG
ncbi:MAG: carbohydrate ABC transporter permease [Lachnospiraceae bacterium]|nr:carbohydrate ABC transporter permease [Lachnospiraceae bacterium]